MAITIEKSDLSEILIPLFRKIHSLNISYCVCGNYDSLPYFTENDVDIWTNNSKALVRIVEEICDTLNYKIYLKNTNAIGTNIFIFTNTASSKKNIIHLDILMACCWHGILPLTKSRTIEEHRKSYKDFYVADETVDAAMHLMYPISHFGKVPTKYHYDIVKEARNENFWEIVKEGWGKTFSEKIMTLVKNGLWNELEEEFAKQKLKLTVRALCMMRMTEVKSVLLFAWSNIERLTQPNGLFIAFVGPDGCGKTTIQNKLDPFFLKGFSKGKIKKFYWRPFLLPRISQLIPRGKKAINEKSMNESPADRLDYRHVGLHKRMFHCLKLIYYWLDYLIGRSRYQGAWSRGGVVCFDRYWGDLLVFPERFGLNVPKWLVRLLGVFVPKPDIVFYLHAEPEVLIGRKLELPLEEMRKQTEEYQSLCRRYDNYVQIDGDQSVTNVIKDVIEVSLTTMSKRYPEYK